ncbi:MAG: Fic family protein [Gammaproteobacteria bacterium]|nr:Fic family protein [Gammaproteobacteria bacterium]
MRTWFATANSWRRSSASAPCRLSRSSRRPESAGNPYDPQRLELFENLFSFLRGTIPTARRVENRAEQAKTNLAFFEAYFSNFIEGTEFSIQEAEEIVFDGVIPVERPDDAHDVLGTFRIVSDDVEMSRSPTDFGEFLDLLRYRHATIMGARQDKRPGEFKTKNNQAGNTVFVAPELVTGTLEKGFAIFRGLGDPFQRAAFVMTLVSEVHPFVDGNGRIARVMMNAELVSANEERIIIPTSYRADYLGALKALSLNQTFSPLSRMLVYAQRYTHSIAWDDLDRGFAFLAVQSPMNHADTVSPATPKATKSETGVRWSPCRLQ